MALLQQILVEGPDSRLYQELVQTRGLAGEVEGGANLLGNQFNYQGPMLWMAYLFHDAGHSPKENRLRHRRGHRAAAPRAGQSGRPSSAPGSRPGAPTTPSLERVFGFGRADLLAVHALFDGDPAAVNRIEPSLLAVTPELIQRTAEEWLRPTNRTVVALQPAGGK